VVVQDGARERKKRATRAQLEEAAHSLFTRQGYEATTVDEISEAADTTVVVDAVLAFSRYLESRRDATLGQRQLVADNPALQGRGRVVEDDWASVMAQSLAERAGADGPTFEQMVLAAAAIGVLSAAVHEWHATGAQAPLSSFTERALGVVGLC
jgi:hypothetical protein